MSLKEFYEKITRVPAPRRLDDAVGSPVARRQFSRGWRNPAETVKDSVHLECRPADPDCPECGVTVILWEGFAHRTLWNRTWRDAVAFQPASTR